MQFININTVSYDWCGALVSCILIYTNSNWIQQVYSNSCAKQQLNYNLQK
jgi:hypothetical protein